MHLLLPAPEFEDRSEAELVRAALQDSSRRIISIVGTEGVGKTALVHQVLAETKTAAFVWRFDLNPDIRDLLDGLSLHVGRQVDHMQALGGLPQDLLIVVDGVQEWLLQRCGEVPQGYALADLVQAIRGSESGARLLLVSRPAPGLELCHSSERIPLTMPCGEWYKRRLSCVKVPFASELGFLARMAHSVRAFEQIRSVLAVLVRSTKDMPLWLKECGRNHQAFLQAVLTRADPDVRAAAFVLAAMPAAISAESVLALHGDVKPREWRAAIDELVQLRLLNYAQVRGQRWYELDALVRPALAGMQCEERYAHRVLLIDRQMDEADSVPGEPADQLRASIEAEDIVGAQYWYGALRRGIQRVVPSATTAQLASELLRQWGARFEQWENEQSPAFDRAVSQIMRGEPKRAEASLLSLRAHYSSLGDSLQPGGSASGRGIALDEALIDAIVAQGDLGRAGFEASQALSRADGVKVGGLLLRRAKIKALVGASQAASVELQSLVSAAPPQRRSGADHVCLAQHMYRLGKVQSAQLLVRRAPDSGLLRARADLILADVMRSRGDYARAKEHALSVHAYAQGDGLIALWAQSLISQARTCYAQGNLQDAVRLAAEAAQIAQDADYGLQYLDASIVGARSGDDSVDLTTILKLARACGYGWALSAVLHLCAERHVQRGEGAAALLCAEEALALREEMQDPKLANTRVVLKSARGLSRPHEGE